MAGFWERVKGDAEERMAVHLVVGAFKGFAAQTWSQSQILNRFEEWLASNGYSPLTSEEQTDLLNISNNIVGTRTDKLEYVVGHIETAMIAAELNQSISYNENAWRTDLNIP